MKKENEEFTLKELFLLFLPKFWIILLCGIICAGAVGVYSAFLKDDTFTSSATIYVYKERNENSSNAASSSYYDSITSQKMVKTYSIVLKSRSFLTKVIELLDDSGNYNLTPESLASAIEIKQIDETEVFNVFFTSKDKELTYKVLSGITELAKTAIKEYVSSTASDVKIIDEPVLPESADSKNVFRNSAIGFVIGFVLCMIAIFLFNQLDVVIRNKRKIEENFDIPVLGVIPRQNVFVKKSGAREKDV